MRPLPLFLALFLAGCASRAAATQAYHVDANGTVSAATRSAADGTTAPGRQEIIGVYLPFPPFDLKASLSYDGAGLPIIIGQPPAPQVAPQAAAPCSVIEEQYVEMETRTVQVPVTRTRQRVVVPVPQAAPRAVCPAPPPAPVSQTSSCRECPGGCCEVPVVTVARR